MNGATAKVRWSETHPPKEVSADHLSDCFDGISSKCRESGVPFIVDVIVHGYEVSLGLGLPESFVHITAESGQPPYFITVGQSSAPGVVAFYLHGAHHTEIARRNLISTPDAIRVIREFLERGERSATVEWEEV
jgi:hypothetical protein